jgi:hypothetical protein
MNIILESRSYNNIDVCLLDFSIISSINHIVRIFLSIDDDDDHHHHHWKQRIWFILEYNNYRLVAWCFVRRLISSLRIIHSNATRMIVLIFHAVFRSHRWFYWFTVSHVSIEQSLTLYEWMYELLLVLSIMFCRRSVVRTVNMHL